MTDTLMCQTAPFPETLQYLVDRLGYRPGWTFRLEDLDRGQGSKGLTLIITTCGYDAYHPDRGEGYRVHHYMLVPPAAYDRRSWLNWLFEQCQLVEKHECMEFFTLVTKGDGERTPDFVERPFAPAHGPGNSPYTVFADATDLDRRTKFTGEVIPE